MEGAEAPVEGFRMAWISAPCCEQPEAGGCQALALDGSEDGLPVTAQGPVVLSVGRFVGILDLLTTRRGGYTHSRQAQMTCREKFMSKTVLGVYGDNLGHWVGDGFPVRTLFSYQSLQEHVSPFLLLDYAGPHYFEPSTVRRGVGEHPHRGFETVTVVYEGEVEHRDSAGGGGVIGAGDVQWMTAARGILHAEFHGPALRQAGGLLRMVQLWVNLPGKDKLAPGRYQALPAASIPVLDLPFGAGKARVIAGEFLGVAGPAHTFTPINVWDLRLAPGADAVLDLPEGHTTMLVVLIGAVIVADTQTVGEAEMALLSREGQTVRIQAVGEATVLVLSGQPLGEPIVGYGPFVMNSETEIRQAISDIGTGRFLVPA